MWLIADYRPVGLFTLKHPMATSSGAKSLLVPTPYAFKMALLDAACRLWGVSRAESEWPALRDMGVALRLPRCAVVTNLFAKVLRPRRSAVPEGAPEQGPLGRTIAFREYVWTGESLGIGLGLGGNMAVSHAADLMLQINYLGRRGCFVQLTRAPAKADALPGGFVPVNSRAGQSAFSCEGLVQMLDDCGPDMTFERANVYSGKAVRLSKDRVVNTVVLPYRLAQSSRSFSVYERIDP